MPQRDAIHDLVKKALEADGWEITDDPYVISFGERFLFVDLGAVETADAAASRFLGARRGANQIAVEIKEFRTKSVMASLEQGLGQYVLYRLLLDKVDPTRELYMAVTDVVYDEVFGEPIGELVVNELPMQLLVVDSEKEEVKEWIPRRSTARS